MIGLGNTNLNVKIKVEYTDILHDPIKYLHQFRYYVYYS